MRRALTVGVALRGRAVARSGPLAGYEQVIDRSTSARMPTRYHRGALRSVASVLPKRRRQHREMLGGAGATWPTRAVVARAIRVWKQP